MRLEKRDKMEFRKSEGLYMITKKVCHALKHIKHRLTQGKKKEGKKKNIKKKQRKKSHKANVSPQIAS